MTRRSGLFIRWKIAGRCVTGLLLLLSLIAGYSQQPAMAQLIPATPTKLIDCFPKLLNGENGIFLQYRDAGGTYTDLVYHQDYYFHTLGTPWNMPSILVWDRVTGDIYSAPSAITQVGYKRDTIIRVILHGDSPTVRVTGATARLPGAGSMRFYIYHGAANYAQPLWETWNEGTFDLNIPYTNGEQLFFAVDAGPNDINDWALWRDIRFQGIVCSSQSLSVSSITPSTGGDTGLVSVTVIGSGYVYNAPQKLDRVIRWTTRLSRRCTRRQK